MGLEAAQYEDILEDTDQQDNPDNQDKTKKENDPMSEIDAVRGKLTDEDKKKIERGEKSVVDAVQETRQSKKDAERLLKLAEDQDKLTKKDVLKLRTKLKTEDNKESIQEVSDFLKDAISKTGAETKDKKAELQPDDPDLKRAQETYIGLVKDNIHFLGVEPAREYEEWIKKQTPTLENLEKRTREFFQSELPERQRTYENLQGELLKNWGIKDPLQIEFIKKEGLSERKEFLKTLVEFRRDKGDLFDKLYSSEAKEALLKDIGKLPKNTDHKQRLNVINKEESQAFHSMETAVLESKMSQKSMDENVAHYKTIKLPKQRLENLKMWEGFIEAEHALTDDLKKVFDQDPANKEGFAIAFRIFKDLNYDGKKQFIDKQTKEREKDIKEEEINKQLTVDAFKHECKKAEKENIISKKTSKNYETWIDKNAKESTYEETKVFLEVLTQASPNEDAKNLAAYKKRRKQYIDDMKKFENISPQLTKKNLDKWQEDYDEKGWNKRSLQHDKLKKEIEKAKTNRVKEKFEKANPEGEKNTESKESNLAIKNKETAMQAIEALIKAGALKKARSLAAKLLTENPEDEKVEDLLDKIALASKEGKEETLMDDKNVFKQMNQAADLIISGDATISEEARRLQTEDTALRLMEESVDRHHGTIKAKDRSQKELHQKTKFDEDVQGATDEFMEGTDDDKVLDEDTLKGKDAVQINFQTKQDRNEKESLRRDIQKEQGKNKEHHGGSSVIEFKRKEGEERSLDKREARALHSKEENELVDQIVPKILAVTHPGQDHSAELLAIARKAALERLRKKEEDKIEQMSKAA
ncbi:hypothetical protein HOE67_05265 [Candidatus Peregrinibacteria bacterium]|jgi:hypothetical protein|nr:hypothetical protein [Candidatus Peregrinibacteria bacterium]MBT4056492.1 hypothetical protein [Candidatus Peregrinibacteria bacterium]